MKTMLLVALFAGASALSTTARRSAVRMQSTAVETEVETKTTLLPRERYIASNRFQTRGAEAQAKFEARWANRKSRLAELKGFRYFTLLRSVPLADVVGEKGAAAMGIAPSNYDYMSFTIWNEKKDFTAWRQGDAFKEAHGGTDIGSFMSAMVSSLFVLKGAPSPVFYDGLLHLSNPPTTTTDKVEGGWRVVEADGVNKLPTECFVATNRFCVRPGAEAEFEERWSNRDSDLKDLPGFKSFTMLRRDQKPPKSHSGEPKKDSMGDDYNYMSFTVWEDREAFAGWRSSKSFKDAHSGGPKREEGALPPWVRPPSVAFWEGILQLTAPEGA